MKKGRIEWLPYTALMVDPSVQRTVIGPRANKLTVEFDPDKVGILHVSQRENGERHLIDGQHRWVAARRAGKGQTKAKCEVFEGLSPEEEAAMFLSLNDARQPSAVDRFKVGLVAGDETAVGVDKVLHKFGLRVSSNIDDGTIACVDRLMALYRRDPALLMETLSVTNDAWNNRRDAVESVVIGGLSKVLATYNGEMDRGVLVRKLRKQPPAGLIANAKLLQSLRPGFTKSQAVGQLIIDHYNKGRRSDLLGAIR